MNVVWSCKSFDALLPREVYAILRLRSEVFVVEQNCVFLDADDHDQSALHIMGSGNDRLVACSRILPAGEKYREVSIGRIVTAATVRRSGVGRALMQRSIQAVLDTYGAVPIRIGAQLYLRDFYASFGFCQDGETYLEDGIKHIEMIRG